MKKIVLFLVLALFIIGCKTKNSATVPEIKDAKKVKIAGSAINDSQQNKAYELGKRVLNTCNTSKFKPFTTAEATASVLKNTTEARLTKTCTRFRQYYGSFIDLQFVEAYVNKADQTTIYRYKAQYTKKVANKELRINMTSDNKVSAIKSLDWVDYFSIN
ncbi:MAG: hypothetical protein ACK4M4_08005 [Flavobacterium sp.]